MELLKDQHLQRNDKFVETAKIPSYLKQENCEIWERLACDRWMYELKDNRHTK